MIKSMTGFGTITVANNQVSIQTSVRSVNGRFLETRLKLPKEYFPFETICANVEEIPLTDNFDKIIAIDIVEHVQNPKKMLNEVHRLLKDNGQLLITFPTIHDRWENLFRFVCRQWIGWD